MFSGSGPINAARTLAVSPARSGATGRSAVSSIHFVMGADVDQEESFRPGLGMFLFGEDDPAVVGGR